MARATVAQKVQIGRESTPGTAVPADKSLGSLSIALAPASENTTFRPKGTKYPTIVAANKEWAVANLEGQPTYEEVVYPLASVLTAPVVSEVMDGATGTGAYTWEFDPSSQGADAPAIFTVEQGDTSQAERVSHVLFHTFGLEFSRSEVTLSGEGIGRSLETDVPLTAGATPVAEDLTPILPGQVCIYVADDPATLGEAGTLQGTAISANPSIGGRYNPVWYLNCTQESFATYVEAPEPDASLEFRTEANANGMAWLDRFRTGATQFVRIEAKGPVVASKADNPGLTEDVQARLTLDFAVKVSEAGALEDEDGIYAFQPTLTVVHDAGWGRAMRAEVVNTLAAL
jgi:hypothetical protein